MKAKKIILALLLVVLLVFAFTGCNERKFEAMVIDKLMENGNKQYIVSYEIMEYSQTNRDLGEKYYKVDYVSEASGHYNYYTAVFMVKKDANGDWKVYRISD